MGTQGSTLEGDRTDTENPFRAQVVDIFNDILDKIERLDSRDLRSVMEGLGLRDLDGENLSEADLSGQDLSGLSFRGVSFAKADCSRTNFSGCDLSGANFAGARVARACFVGAVLDGTVGLPRTVASSKPREQASKPRERAERGARSAVLYEHVFIARQDLAQAQVDALTDTAARIIEEAGGKVVKTESWGLRSLAYRIAKNRKGHYVMLDFEAPPSAVAELERQTQINEDVIRYMTVRVEQHERGPSAMMARGERSKAPESEDGSGARQRVRFRGENA